MTIAFIALGANKTAWHKGRALAPRQAITAALAALDALPQCYVVAASGLYLSPPVGPGTQRPYVNAVAALDVPSDLESFIKTLHSVEDQFRRQRKRAWQARSLDLDVLDFGNQVQPSLQAWRQARMRPWPNRLALRCAFLKDARRAAVPHVRMDGRSFVMTPLFELCPNWLHPIFQKTAAQLQRSIDRGSLRRIGAVTL